MENDLEEVVCGKGMKVGLRRVGRCALPIIVVCWC